MRTFSPKAAQGHGVQTVFQEILTAPNCSIADNVFLGYHGYLRPAPRARSRSAGRKELFAERLLRPRHRRARRPAACRSTSSAADRHLSRAPVREPRVLILDEPTAALGLLERWPPFTIVRRLRAAGVLVIFVFHRMDDEVMDILRPRHGAAQRQGRRPRGARRPVPCPAARADGPGGRVSAEPQAPVAAPAADTTGGAPAVRAGEPLLEASGLQLLAGTGTFDFALRTGEIVGLAGLDGHGQSAFLETLAGIAPPIRGSIAVMDGGARVPVTDARVAYRHGIVYLPQDRKSEGIFPSLSILDNFRMLTVGEKTRFGFISTRRARAAFGRHREQLDIVLSTPDAPITSLSGGNQQKVLLARLLQADPRIMLLNDPTRGVDYPTRLALFAAFEELAGRTGLGIVVLSTEIDEIVTHCHRAVVFREGVPSAEIDRASLTRDAVLAGMFGVSGSAA
ncbi:MAG: ATP-binding cassette domain-containing protein [Chloroflexota bacterium]